MLQRLYVHNFRCLENFEFKPGQQPSSLLIGKNGSGKSTIACVLAILQSIGRGVNRVGQLVEPGDCTLGRTGTPMRFELEAHVAGRTFHYTLALELPERFREMRVLEEQLLIDGSVAYSRQQSLVTLHGGAASIRFNIDWHLLALPLIQDQAIADPLTGFKQWLARMVILAPLPRLMNGDSNQESLEPRADGTNFADWLAGLLAQFPAAYGQLSDHLKQLMPDLADFRNAPTGKDAKSLLVRFTAGSAQFEFPFKMLSDGEKCFCLCAVVVAANKAYGPLLCFWDEPDNYLSLSEVGHFTMALRRAFQQGGQILATSHNEEAIRKFSRENTWLLERDSHLEPTQIRLLSELAGIGDIVGALIRGDLES